LVESAGSGAAVLPRGGRGNIYPPWNTLRTDQGGADHLAVFPSRCRLPCACCPERSRTPRDGGFHGDGCPIPLISVSTRQGGCRDGFREAWLVSPQSAMQVSARPRERIALIADKKGMIFTDAVDQRLLGRSSLPAALVAYRSSILLRHKPFKASGISAMMISRVEAIADRIDLGGLDRCMMLSALELAGRTVRKIAGNGSQNTLRRVRLAIDKRRPRAAGHHSKNWLPHLAHTSHQLGSGWRSIIDHVAGLGPRARPACRCSWQPDFGCATLARRHWCRRRRSAPSAPTSFPFCRS